MGQASRRRKGKSGSRSSTPTPSAESETKVDTDDSETKKELSADTMEVENQTPVLDVESLLVLTSEKRRGVYECDYCHSDISQQPRIRSAVCSDFDLCLDCFTTSDHEAMIARIKAAAQTQAELTKDGIDSTAIVVSSAAANHEAHHQYRVCDSTRYPIFPTGRIAPPPSTAPETNDQLSGQNEAEAHSLFNKNVSFHISLSDDPKTMWTAEEDLRLIDAISTHGLGNWVDISEAISGHGSIGKTPKRCMEHYLDDFLGRYGHILPQYTIVDDTVEERTDSTSVNNSNADTSSNDTGNDTKNTVATETKSDQGQNKAVEGEEETPSEEQSEKKEGDQPTTAGAAEPAKMAPSAKVATPSIPMFKNIIEEEEGVRTSKRRSAAGTSGASLTSGGRSSSRKKLKVVSTESFPGYENIWPRPYLPEFENAVPGQEAAMDREVARDQSCKAEVAFVKSTLGASSKKEADKIRKTWIDTKLGKVGSPTVLPPRPQDAVHLLGSELSGFMPRRGDFDVEYDNEAESALADMEFIRGDKPEDKELKLKVLQIYCEKLDERQKRKKFVLERHLYDYRKYVQNDLLLPVDERDLVHRMRLFERFHTPDEHKKFIVDILKAKRLRKEIAKLQMYRRIGIKSLVEAEMYELDKDRRQFHKKLEGDAKAKAANSIANAKATTKGTGTTSNELATGPTRTPTEMRPTDSLWKKYRTNDRKNRRNSIRSGNPIQESSEKDSDKNTLETTASNGDDAKEKDKKEAKEIEVKEIEVKEIEVKEAEVEKAEVKEAKVETAEVKEAGVKESENESAEGKETTGDQQMEIEKDEDVDEDEPMADAKTIDATKKQDEATTDVEDKPNKEEFDMTRASCRELLSRKELALCERQQIYPIQYLEIKKVLIHEALINGLLDKDSSNSSKRTIVKIDVERRGNVVNFLVRAGWIGRKLADVAMRVVTPQPS